MLHIQLDLKMCNCLVFQLLYIKGSVPESLGVMVLSVSKTLIVHCMLKLHDNLHIINCIGEVNDARV